MDIRHAPSRTGLLACAFFEVGMCFPDHKSLEESSE